MLVRAAATLCWARALSAFPLSSRSSRVGPSVAFPPFARGFSQLEGNASLKKTVKCIIFDKDGTLISFHHTWSPWADGLINRLAKSCAAHVHEQVKGKQFDTAKVESLMERAEENTRKKVAATLGYDLSSRRVAGESALLAWAAQPLIQAAVEKCLTEQLGLSRELAATVTQDCWRECDGKEEVVAISRNTTALLSRIRAEGIKIAVCTSDVRVPTEANLRSLGIFSLVDEIVCGDDSANVPKPAPDNVLNICNKLAVSPGETMMVGDTNADLKMGGASGCGWTVAVLSGVGSHDDLSPNANVVIDTIDDLESVLHLISWE